MDQHAERRVGAVHEALRLTALAFGFMTRVPVPASAFRPGDLRRASGAFPLVGLAVAAVGVVVRAALGPLLGAVPATLAALVAMIAVTGALHEDGLADTADGLWGAWDRERRLAIMRDSRIGTYGVLALVAVTGLRAALLAPLGLADFARAAACGHVLGRGAILVLAGWLPAAAAGGGADVAGPVGRGRILAAGSVVAATLLLATGRWAAVPLLVALAVTVGCGRLFRRRLGGITGDTLGAACQLVELATLAVVLALVRGGRL